eukprot:scaffold40511_cov63-Phaeocystis_antarctica.AAC.4
MQHQASPHAHAHTRKHKCSLACAARGARARCPELETQSDTPRQHGRRQAGSHDSPLRGALCFHSARPPPEPRAWRTGYSTGDPAALWYRFTKNMVIVYGTTDTLNVRTRVTKRHTPVLAA